MSNSSENGNMKKLFTPGTPQCALLCALIGAAIAALLLTIGFWKTLFIAAFGAVGGLLGGISNKANAVRDLVNRRIPDRDAPIKEIAREHTEMADMVGRIVSDKDTENDTQEEE